MPALEEKDEIVEKLQQLLKEFRQHEERVGAWATTLRGDFVAGSLTPEKVAEAVVQLALDLKDTSLSLQADVVQAMIDDMTRMDDDYDDEDDYEDEEVGSVLVKEDADQLRRPVSEYIALCEHMLRPDSGYAEDDRRAISAKLADAKAALDLIERIELDEEQVGGDEEEEDEAGEEDEADAGEEDADDEAPVDPTQKPS